MSKKHPLVYIEWEDSSASGGVWNGIERLAKMKNQRCTSIGYLVHEDRDCVVVAGHKGGFDFSGDMRIPKRSILRKKRIRLA